MRSRNDLIAALLAIVLVTCFFAISLGIDSKVTKPHGMPADATGKVSPEILQTSNHPQRGKQTANFTLVEFGDFQCANCAAAQPVIRDLMQRHPDLGVVFRHLPLVELHPQAVLAARAAEAANRQHKFWQMADALYEHQQDWSQAQDVEAALVAQAGELGLDTRRFTADLKQSADIDHELNRDRKVAQMCSVNTTPSFFLITPTHVWAIVGDVGLQHLRDGAEYWK